MPPDVMEDLDQASEQNGSGAGKGTPGKGGDKPSEVEKQLERANARIRELEESERFWAGRATKGDKTDDKRNEPDDDVDPAILAGLVDGEDGEEGDDTPEKLAEELTSDGIKALQKRGFLTKKEALKLVGEVAAKVTKRMIGQTTRQLENDSRLVREFPELGDETSDLYKRTAQIYQEMAKEDKSLAKSPAALRHAAKLAAAQIRLEGKPAAKPGRRDMDDDDEGGNEFEVDDPRINRQGDPGTRRSNRGADEDDEDEALSPMQRRILDRFNADGNKISEKDYRTAARKLRLSGVPTRRVR